MFRPFALAVLVSTSACHDDDPNDTREEAPLRVVQADPTDDPHAELSAEWRRRFAVGDQAFERRFGPEDGLGPTWARESCEGCHEGDGRGPGMVRRVAGSVTEYPAGDVLRPFALPGHEREPLPRGVPTADRLGPALFGRGWIEAVANEAIEAGARAQAEHPEISGRVARVPFAGAVEAQRPFAGYPAGATGLVGRFGLKARHATVDDFVADAYLVDMGLTTPLRPEELDGGDGHGGDGDGDGGDGDGDDEDCDDEDCDGGDLVPGVDVDLATVHAVADYVRLVAIPRRAPVDAAGQAVFARVGCATCHTPAMPTRADYPIDALAGQDAPIYSDLLLHDMGPDLADGLSEHGASGSEWRTAPLIGIRHLRGLLHDGRADTVDQAIRAHGGEAAATVGRYRALSDGERAAVVRFVEGL